jgi:hypothetical protein
LIRRGGGDGSGRREPKKFQSKKLRFFFASFSPHFARRANFFDGVGMGITGINIEKGAAD